MNQDLLTERHLKEFTTQGLLTETHLREISTLQLELYFSPWLTTEQAWEVRYRRVGAKIIDFWIVSFFLWFAPGVWGRIGWRKSGIYDRCHFPLILLSLSNLVRSRRAGANCSQKILSLCHLAFFEDFAGDCKHLRKRHYLNVKNGKKCSGWKIPRCGVFFRLCRLV
jgi:hypothetical protein